MEDKQEPTAEVKREHIIEALDILSFEEIMGLYVKVHSGKIKIVVDLTDDKQSVYFKDGSSVISQDDDAGTLAKIGKIIIDAEQGIMPSVPEQQPKPVPSYTGKTTGPTSQGELPAPIADTDTGVGDYAPAEIVHNPAAPLSSFEPQGTMIMDIQPGLAEIGAIKIGGPGEEKISKASGKTFRIPVKYDHFVIRTKQKNENGDYIVDPIMKKWGYEDGEKYTFFGSIPEGPTELDIYLLYNDPAANFMTSYRQYKGGKCMCTGNGISAVKADGTKIQCNTETCPIFKSKQCKPNGILSVILKDAPTLGGVYKFRTTSFNSIRQILSSMHFIKSATGGFLANLPLKMTLTPKTVNPIDSPTAQTIYIVNLVFAGNVEDLRKRTVELVRERATMKQEILAIEAQAKLALCAPETGEEIQEIESEFYTENTDEVVK